MKALRVLIFALILFACQAYPCLGSQCHLRIPLLSDDNGADRLKGAAGQIAERKFNLWQRLTLSEWEKRIYERFKTKEEIKAALTIMKPFIKALARSGDRVERGSREQDEILIIETANNMHELKLFADLGKCLIESNTRPADIIPLVGKKAETTKERDALCGILIDLHKELIDNIDSESLKYVSREAIPAVFKAAGDANETAMLLGFGLERAINKHDPGVALYSIAEVIAKIPMPADRKQRKKELRDICDIMAELNEGPLAKMALRKKASEEMAVDHRKQKAINSAIVEALNNIDDLYWIRDIAIPIIEKTVESARVTFELITPENIKEMVDLVIRNKEPEIRIADAHLPNGRRNGWLEAVVFARQVPNGMDKIEEASKNPKPAVQDLITLREAIRYAHGALSGGRIGRLEFKAVLDKIAHRDGSASDLLEAMKIHTLLGVIHAGKKWHMATKEPRGDGSWQGLQKEEYRLTEQLDRGSHIEYMVEAGDAILQGDYERFKRGLYESVTGNIADKTTPDLSISNLEGFLGDLKMGHFNDEQKIVICLGLVLHDYGRLLEGNNAGIDYATGNIIPGKGFLQHRESGVLLADELFKSLEYKDEKIIRIVKFLIRHHSSFWDLYASSVYGEEAGNGTTVENFQEALYFLYSDLKKDRLLGNDISFSKFAKDVLGMLKVISTADIFASGDRYLSDRFINYILKITGQLLTEKSRILIVQDYGNIAEGRRIMLEKNGMPKKDIVVAKDYQAAIGALKETKFSLIILDMGFPVPADVNDNPVFAGLSVLEYIVSHGIVTPILVDSSIVGENLDALQEELEKNPGRYPKLAVSGIDALSNFISIFPPKIADFDRVVQDCRQGRTAL